MLTGPSIRRTVMMMVETTNDAYAALAVAVLYPTEITPETAMKRLFSRANTRVPMEILEEIFQLREQKTPWKIIGQTFGISDTGARKRYKRYLKITGRDVQCCTKQ